jgi:proteasome lid subunit RPN8/RPN11
MLRATPGQLDAIRRHAEDAYPQECCGFLLGSAREDVKEVVRLVPAENERKDSANRRYLISPEAYLSAERDASARGLDIIGFYHSHPDHPARPSEFDRVHALPWCSYIIVSVQAKQAGDLTSWVLSEGHRFDAEPVETSLPADKEIA